MLSPAVDNLVAQLTRLPGIGTRTAQRLTFHLLSVSTEEALALGETTSAVAAEFGVTPGAVSQFRLRFKTMFDTFMAG